MHQTPLPCFLPQLPLPSWSFSLPLLWHTPPCIFASTAPIPQIRFCLTPLDFFCDYIYTRIFSSLPMSVIPSCVLYQLTPPRFVFSASLRHTLLLFCASYPPPPFIFATFRTPDFSQPPLQFSLLYPRKLVSCVVHFDTGNSHERV